MLTCDAFYFITPSLRYILGNCSYFLQDINGKVICPELFKVICPKCGSTGENAHCVRYCPHRNKFKGAPPPISPYCIAAANMARNAGSAGAGGSEGEEGAGGSEGEEGAEDSDGEDGLSAGDDPNNGTNRLMHSVTEEQNESLQTLSYVVADSSVTDAQNLNSTPIPDAENVENITENTEGSFQSALANLADWTVE